MQSQAALLPSCVVRRRCICWTLHSGAPPCRHFLHPVNLPFLAFPPRCQFPLLVGCWAVFRRWVLPFVVPPFGLVALWSVSLVGGSIHWGRSLVVGLVGFHPSLLGFAFHHWVLLFTLRRWALLWWHLLCQHSDPS